MQLINIDIDKYFHMIPSWKSPITLPLWSYPWSYPWDQSTVGLCSNISNSSISTLAGISRAICLVYSLYIPYIFHIYFLAMFHIFSLVCFLIYGVKSKSGHDRSQSSGPTLLASDPKLSFDEKH